MTSKFNKLRGSSINVIEPGSIGVDASVEAIEAWILANQSELQEALSRDGAVVFRGFDVNTPADFERVGLAVNPNLATRYPGGAPRQSFGKHVWSASETPGHMPISSHCELSYIPCLRPKQIMFYCLDQPETGGETPVANMHEVWERLPADLQRRFEEEEVEVIRSFPAEKRFMLDVRRVKVPVTSWPNVLGSSDPAKVREDATADGVKVNFWKASTVPPVLKWLDGITAKSSLWRPLNSFVQAMIWIFSCLPAHWPLDEFSENVNPSEVPDCTVELVTTFPGIKKDGDDRKMYIGLDVFFSEYGWAAESLFVALRTRRMVHILLAMKILAGTVCFGTLRLLGIFGRAPLDLQLGASLGPLDVLRLNRAYWTSFHYLQWQKGDVLVLNNDVCSHGRMPFTGPRKILTAFG